MTHEYVIALRGRIPGADTVTGTEATAIAWAVDRVLAVGSDASVQSISRGDSTFIDLEQCIITGIDAGPGADLGDPSASLEPGSPADLDFWMGDPPQLVATVRAGAFTEGDVHRGPFRVWAPAGSSAAGGG